MKRSTQVLSALLVLAGSPVPHAWGNEWTNRGGMFNPGGGWFDWVQNTVDGRHCALGYKGNLQCYDPATNVLETVYVNASQTPDPQNGDLQIFGWDHVNQEYIAMDGGRTIGPDPLAFSMITRTWRILTNADFDGIESRTKTGGAASAASPDHDLFVVFAGSNGGYVGRKTLLYDLRNRTYGEVSAPASMPARNRTQGQLLYISSLRKFLLFGGVGSDGKPLNDLWLFDPVTSEWTSVTAQDPPSGRYFGQMAYDSINDLVFLYGGHGATDGSVSVLHVATWTWEHVPEPPGTVRVDFPGIRRVGAGIFDPGAGFCSGAGVLAGADWIRSAHIWCWTHTFGDPPDPPEPPPPGWVLTISTPDRVRFEFQQEPPTGAVVYDCIGDATVIDCQKR